MISVILCGGVGSRLWPISRDMYPKPFLKLSDGQSFIQKAFIRGASLPEAEGVVTVTGKELLFKIKDEFKTAGVNMDSSYILEPVGRNTAPAIAVAALSVIKQYDEDMLMMVLASDHLIQKAGEFKARVADAMELARDDKLVTFGIAPNRPETGYGYIETDGTKVVRFVEKPCEEKAREYLASGNFLWNSGMFCFKAGVFLEELGKYAPDILESVEKCFAASTVDRNGCLRLSPELFGEVPSNSIDFAVMEKSRRVAVVKCDIGWNDVGSWSELCALEPVDGDGNHVSSPDSYIGVDTKNCDIFNNEDQKLVATLGLDNVLIVDTADAILVADKSRAQDVRLVYNRLKEADHEAHKQHRTVHRPWGTFSILEQGTRFKIKKLTLVPGAIISLQQHYHRSEHWIVVSGMARVTCDDETFLVHTNESAYIKAGRKHRVANPGKIDLVIIEVQSGDYVGEDDIERFEDIYGRD